MSRKLLKSTAVIGAMTMLSRVLGFVRDVLLARLFGAGAATDAFFVVFKIPNFLRRLFAEGAFQQAFVPVLSEYREKHGPEELKSFVDHMFGTLATVLLLVVSLGVIGAPLVILLFAPGFTDDPAQRALAEQMLWITFPYLFFISLTAFAASTLNTFGRFAMPALTPIWLNIALIGAALFLAPRMEEPVMGLAWGVFIAGVLQLGFLMPFLARIGLLPRPRFGRHPGVRKTVRLMIPAMFGASVTQISLLIDTILASLLVAGSVSWLYYSDRLVELPLGVFGVALATVILPKLSREHARQTPEAFNATLNWAVRLTLLIGLPATAGLVLLSGPILATLFEYGEFTPHDTQMVRLALMAYALGLPAFLLIKVLAPAFFSRQDTATPVRVAVISVLIGLGLKGAIMVPWMVFEQPAAHVGLALATALVAWINAGMLAAILRRRAIWTLDSGIRRATLQTLAGCSGMILLLWWLTPAAGQWTTWDGWQRSAQLAGLIALGGLAFVATATVAGMRPDVFRRDARHDGPDRPDDG
ncbi:MAG: murein biosynthesis integral membrane protein MurJ [Halothiobacillaceae bacterium]